MKNREKIQGKGSAQPRVKIESLALDPRGVTVMTVTPQRTLVSVGGMTVAHGRYFFGGLRSEAVIFIATAKTRSETAIFSTEISQRTFLNPEVVKKKFDPSLCTVFQGEHDGRGCRNWSKITRGRTRI